MAAALRQIVHDPDRVTEEEVLAYSAALEEREGLRAALDVGRSIVPRRMDELVARYPTVTARTQIVWGRQDKVVPLWVGQRLARELPHARLDVMERCGHVPPEEHPLDSWRIVERFLDEAAPPVTRR